MATEQQHSQELYIPAKTLDTPYPLIDSDPHFKRVYSYARPVDWALGAGMGALGPALHIIWERTSPSLAGPGAFAKAMRLTAACSITGGFLLVAARSSNRFYGFNENRREEEMDMREMVEKVKKGEPLYGKSTLTPYMQGVASRNSRYAGVFFHMIPWFNFVNHEHHGVDTAKYYQQAERELEADRTKGKA